MIGSHSRKEEITQTNAPPPCFVRKKEETKAENSCQKSQTTWHRGKLLFSALDLVIGVLLQSRGSFASGPQGLLERLIFSSNRSTRRQFDDLRWNVPLEAGTLALQSLLLHHLHPWQHLATTQLDHSSCLMQLHRSAVAFTFLSLYLCLAFPSHCLRKLTCFIAVSLCPWWFVTNINRQTSSVLHVEHCWTVAERIVTFATLTRWWVRSGTLDPWDDLLLAQAESWRQHVSPAERELFFSETHEFWMESLEIVFQSPKELALSCCDLWHCSALANLPSALPKKSY